MSEYFKGTVLASPTVNSYSGDTYGTHHSVLGVGGYMEVKTIAERDLIPIDSDNGIGFDGISSGRRRLGMLVYVYETDIVYKLDPQISLGDWNALGLSCNTLQQLAILSSANNWIEFIKLGGGENISKRISQTNHLFVVGDVLAYSGSTYFKVNSTTANQYEPLGIVNKVIDVNTFNLVYSGNIDTSGIRDNTSMLLFGSTKYYLSETSGKITNIEPTDINKISKPVLVTMSGGTSGVVLQYRGFSKLSQGVDYTTFQTYTGDTQTYLDKTVTGATNIGLFTGHTDVQTLNIISSDSYYSGEYVSKYNYYYRDENKIIRLGSANGIDFRQAYVRINNPVQTSWVWDLYSNQNAWSFIDGDVSLLVGIQGSGNQPTTSFIDVQFQPGYYSSNDVSFTAVGDLNSGSLYIKGGPVFKDKTFKNLNFRTILSKNENTINITYDDSFIYISGKTGGDLNNVGNGLTPKAAAFVATTGNIGLSGLTIVDGIQSTEGMRVFVKNQTDGSQNGIYSATTGTWNRTDDYNFTSGGTISNGDYISVLSGNTNMNGSWILLSPDPIFSGNTLTYGEFSKLMSVAGGSGINVNTIGTNRVVSINLASGTTSGLVSDGNGLKDDWSKYRYGLCVDSINDKVDANVVIGTPIGSEIPVMVDSGSTYCRLYVDSNSISNSVTAGSDTQIIFNNNKTLTGTTSLKYDYSLNSLIVGSGTAIGSNTVVLGAGTARGLNSISMTSGRNCVSAINSLAVSCGTACGVNSIAINCGIAIGDNSIAINNGTSRGVNSISFGNSLTCGNYSVGLSNATAIGCGSVALASGISRGNYSVGITSGNACGVYSVAMAGGVSCGQNSLAVGFNNISKPDNSVVIGGFNSLLSSGNTNSVLLGGSSLTIPVDNYADSVIVPNLVIWGTPTTGTNIDQQLVWNSTDKKVKVVGEKNTSNYTIITGNTTLTTGSTAINIITSDLPLITINLPNIPLDGQIFEFKDAFGASLYPIKILTSGSFDDNENEIIINTDWGGVKVMYFGVYDSWLVLNKYA